jgi:phage-related minor tail protein
MDRIGTEARQAGAAVSQSFQRAAAEASETEPVFLRVGKAIGGLFAAQQLIQAGQQFGRAIAREAMDAEREVALLNATLRSTGFAAGLSANQINDLADEISKVTSIDAGDILQGTTALLRFREIGGDTFREVSRLAVDLAVATGTSVPEAFAKVGRAVQDPVNGARALRDVGVRLTESQAELAKSLKATGDEAGAQRIILDELAKSVGGSGAAANTGLTGATNTLRNSWNDLLTTIGQMPVVARAAQNSVSELQGGVNLLNRLLSPGPVPGNISGTISIPGVTKPGGKIGQLSAAEVQALQEASKRAGTKDFRIATPTTPTTDGGGGVDLSSGNEKVARMGVQMYFDQFQDLQAQAKVILDEAKKTRLEIEQEIIRGIGVGPELAAKQQREFEDKAAKLIAETRSGREQALIGVGGDLDSLNEALIRGPDAGGINAQQYEEAFALIQDRLNDVRGISKETFKAVGDDGGEAFRRLEFAVQGWGRQFTDQLVDMVKTGQFQFSTLVDSILTDLARLAVQQTITQPIFNALAAGLSSGFGGVFGSPSSSTPTSGIGFGAGQGLTLGGPRADGGRVMPGMIYPINERGMEFFAPSVPGTVIPANGFAGGAAPVTMNLTVNVDARSDIATVRAAVSGAADLALARMQRASRGRGA